MLIFLLQIRDKEFSTENFKDIEQELFSGPSPFSLFRGFFGYFHNPEDKQKYSFRFLSGTVHVNIDEHVTHIFLEENNPNIIQQYFQQFPRITIINSKYIEDCFKTRTLLASEDYTVQNKV